MPKDAGPSKIKHCNGQKPRASIAEGEFMPRKQRTSDRRTKHTIRVENVGRGHLS